MNPSIVYNINEAYTSFVNKYGVDPTGILIHPGTLSAINAELKSILVVEVSDEEITGFRGMPIYQSTQMKLNEIKFVV